MTVTRFLAVLAVLVISRLASAQESQLEVDAPVGPVALVGATLIDVTDAGHGRDDIEDAAIVFEGDSILAVGARSAVTIPEGARVIDVTGSWILPGLIDGFATINNQTYADAYLGLGVTSIVAVGGGRRGPIDRSCTPSPRLFRLDGIGQDPMSSVAAAVAEVDRLASENYHVALLMYGLNREQLGAANARAHEHGMATIGELGFTSYKFGDEIGLDAFVHTTRYSLDAAPHVLAEGVAQEPFSNDLASPKWRYYSWLTGADLESPSVLDHAEVLGTGTAALMPTLSLLYLDMERHENPWSFAPGAFLKASDVDAPADPVTGRHVYDASHLHAYGALAKKTIEWEKRYHAAGARYIAGSATDVWGTMPGISLHTELELLSRVGLEPREILAAATSNVAEALHMKRVGRIAPGSAADLLVVDSNPLLDLRGLRDARLVVAKGQLIQPLHRTRLVKRRTVGHSPGGAAIEEVHYRSDGYIVRGYLAIPPGPGPHPACVRLRGGNRSFGAYSDERAVRTLGRVVDWGYAVIAPQFRGSDDPEEGTSLDEFGGAEVNDIFTMIELLAESPTVDTQRMGIEGWSRGGMMTLLALRQSGRFRAAIVVGGLSDLGRMVEDRPVMMDVCEELFGTADEALFARRMRERSAVAWTDELPRTTPILLMHGTSDWRVNPLQTYDLARGLQAAGVPYRLVMYEGGDHSLSEHRDEVHAARRAWLDRYVRDGEVLPDLKPHGR